MPTNFAVATYFSEGEGPYYSNNLKMVFQSIGIEHMHELHRAYSPKRTLRLCPFYTSPKINKTFNFHSKIK